MASKEAVLHRGLSRADACDLSVIIPAHNAEKYMRQTLESVATVVEECKSTVVQIVVVINGSKDATDVVVREFAASWTGWIDVFEMELGCLSSARNLALDNSKGRYIAFLDSDDIWLSGMRDVIPLVHSSSSDIIEFNAVRFSDEVDIPLSKGIFDQYLSGSCGQVFLKESVFKFAKWYVWTRFFKASVLEVIRFSPARRYEDINFVAFAYLKARSIYSTSVRAIGYRINPSSITSNPREKDVADLLYFLDEQKQWLALFTDPQEVRLIKILRCNTWTAAHSLQHSMDAVSKEAKAHMSDVRRELLVDGIYRELGPVVQIHIKFGRLYGFYKSAKRCIKSLI